jgi:hypothetical protein
MTLLSARTSLGTQEPGIYVRQEVGNFRLSVNPRETARHGTEVAEDRIE